MSEIIWKDIRGYEGLYKVSNLGEIKSLDRHTDVGGKFARHQHERILRANPDRQGYLRVDLAKKYQHKTCRVHRLVADAFIANPYKKVEINHKDGNKFNNNVNNLEWATSAENLSHAFLCGISKRNYAPQPVELIDENHITYFPSITRASKETGFSFSLIRRKIRDNEGWRSVT